ncbi:MAG: S8 family serine peptidase [Roseiflexaceae bacterium]
MARITINGISVDPIAEAEGHVLGAADIEAADASTSDYILIQTKQPLDQAQKAELANLGVTILEYVPENTYLCHYKGTDLSAIRALPYVTWANIYMRGFKVAPALIAPAADPKALTLSEVAARPERPLTDTPKTVDVIFQNDVDPETVRAKLAAAARLDPADLKLSSHKARIIIKTRYLPDLAAIDEVRNIEEVVPMKLHNNIARQLLKVGVPNNGTIFEGDGQTVAVADTGFDKGSAKSVHPAFRGRVVKLYALGRPKKANDPNGHGTHVAGSVLGDGTSAKLGISIRGTAPKARLILQSVLDAQGGLGGLPDDLHDLFTPIYQNDGVRIHTNSWGSTRGDGRYDSEAREVDDFVWNHRDFVICFAAGNEGSDRQATGRIAPGSITPPGTAKNCITVGATENNRPSFSLTYGQGWPDDFPVAPIVSDPVANNPEGMVAFSSRGPTQDGRIKPDVVAPGTFILSALSRSVTAANPGWGKTEDPLYFFEGGTSMATPLVAGCVALVREYLAKQHQMKQPSAALVKATLINGAKNIAGQYVPTEAGSLPNISEGFGRVDLAATIGPFAAPAGLTLKDEATTLDTNQEEHTTVTITAPVSLLKVTLVWTDPAGETLQNDLDLIVRAANGQERHGNVSAASADFDRVNNVEQVVWSNVPTGAVDIIVRAHRIALFPQTYALVVRTA